VVGIFKLRGFVVLCDRHFIFEHRLESSESNELLSVRLHNWLLRRFYPRPDIVVFLDADAAFLQKRKMEWPVEHLEYQRQTIIKQRPLVGHFVTIDTTQPLAVVVDQVANEIVQYRSARDRNEPIRGRPSSADSTTSCPGNLDSALSSWWHGRCAWRTITLEH
jgi:thymidylate kinase